MKKLILLFLFSLKALASFPQRTSEKLSIGINYNTELLGLAYFIGFEGADIENKTVEINGKLIPKKEWHSYGYFIYEQYKKFATSENLAKSFSKADRLWLDYLINLLVQLDDFPKARLPQDIGTQYFLDFSVKKDTAEARQNAAMFLDGLNKFTRKSIFSNTSPIQNHSMKRLLLR